MREALRKMCDGRSPFNCVNCTTKRRQKCSRASKQRRNFSPCKWIVWFSKICYSNVSLAYCLRIKSTTNVSKYDKCVISYYFCFYTDSNTLNQKTRSLLAVLKIASNSTEQLDKIEKIDELSNTMMLSNLEKFEKQIQFSLQQLIRTAMNRQCDPVSVSRYKQLYSAALQSSRDKSSPISYANHLKAILTDISTVLPDIGNLSKRS